MVHPSPENDELYRPVDPGDPEIIKLAESIRLHGVMEPLVITQDNYLLSGHRRHAAARLAGLTELPCRVDPVRRCAAVDSAGEHGIVSPDFVVKLREYNRQREKSLDEKLREAVVSADPEDAYAALSEYREGLRRPDPEAAFAIEGVKRRPKISKAKEPFVRAIIAVMTDLKRYWPLTDRQIHYRLLNDPPLKHASKPDSTYRNDEHSYKALTELLTRMRLERRIPMFSIIDETRPCSLPICYRDAGVFLGKEADGMFKGYWRDLMQSQPDHIEIVGEKLTIQSIIEPVAEINCIPLTIGRGCCSLYPRAKIAERYRKSGKRSLTLLILSDFDPDGEEIAHSFARSMRDDFGIHDITPVKVALTAEQVEEYGLPPQMKAKESSSNYEKFVERYDDDDVFELEALEPGDLKEILEHAIDSVVVADAFNAEVEKEKEEAAFLDEQRQRVLAALADRGTEG
jgi:hypothetical protein